MVSIHARVLFLSQQGCAKVLNMLTVIQLTAYTILLIGEITGEGKGNGSESTYPSENGINVSYDYKHQKAQT